MAREINKAIAQRFVEEVFNAGDFRIIDELFAEDFVVNGRTIGRGGLKQAADWWRTRFPDLQVRAGPFVAEAEHVGFWYTARGTQQGEFAGLPASGKQVTWFGFDLLRIVHHRVTEAWFVADRLGLAEQLGARLVLK
jgi:steroid delta-isomerase-like uncharacterized protein